MNNTSAVLFAMEDESVQAFLDATLPLYKFRYTYSFATTLPEVYSWLSCNVPICVVMTVGLALETIGGSTRLIDIVPPHVPTISLVNRAVGYPDYLYTRENLHTWCTMPFDAEEIIDRIYSIVEKPRNMNSGGL